VGPAAGQAWLPEKGEGSFSTSYNYIAFNGHFRTDGTRTAEAASRAQNILLGVEYGLTDRFALSLSVPIVMTRYADTNPPSEVLHGLFAETVQAVGTSYYGHQFLDDQSYHATLQDFYFNARYNLVSRPLVLTPFVALGVPSHDYAYVGEAAPGRDLREFQFGTYIARRLDPFLRKAYLQGQISFAIPEESLDVRTNRVNGSLEFGYFLTRRIAARGFANWQHTFRGLRFPEDLTTPEIALTHDRLLKANYWHLGGGLSYVINPQIEISGDVVTFLAGNDTHYGTEISLGITRNFALKRHRLTSP
jgi:hypothetical protein